MLEIAEQRAKKINVVENVTLTEMGAAELGNEESNSYDVIMSGLCFSELSEDELIYTLKEVERMLKQGGILLIADEVTPQSILKRILHRLMRFSLVIITYLITQTTTHAVKNLPEKVEKAGLIIESIKLSKIENFIELVARKAKEGAK